MTPDSPLSFPATEPLRLGRSTFGGKVIGLIKVVAPAGRYQLRLTMGPLWQEIVGYVASVFGLLGLVLCWRAEHHEKRGIARGLRANALP